MQLTMLWIRRISLLMLAGVRPLAFIASTRLAAPVSEYYTSNFIVPVIFVLLSSWHDVSSSYVSSLLVINLCFLSGLKCFVTGPSAGVCV